MGEIIMSFETFVTIIVTTVIGVGVVSIPILFNIWPFKRRNEGRNRDKVRKKDARNIIKFSERKRELQKSNNRLTKDHKIFLCLVLLGVLVITVVIIIYLFLRPSAYNDAINKAEFEFGNRNYIEAAKYYNEAAYVAYDIETKVSALYYEGACYIQLGLYSDDNNYFSQALRKYYLIIGNSKYKDTEYYRDALIDSSFALRELYGKWDDENLTNIIYQLENTYDFSNIDDISLEDVDLMNKVALAIAVYYKYAANDNFEIGNKDKTKELSDKAIYYYGVVCQLTPQADIIHFKNTDLLYMYLEISELMIKGSLSSGNYTDALTNFNNTINFCKSAIDTFEISEKDTESLNVYLKLKINLGKSYYLLSGLAGEEYLSMAYDELKPLIYLNVGRDIEYTLLDAGYYLILTKNCTTEEIDIILDRYENQLNGMTMENENYLTLIQSALETCKFIVDIYEENSRAVEKGEELSIKVGNLLSIYNN